MNSKTFCAFFNSPAFTESKNDNIFILRLKYEMSLTKMYWEHHIWNYEYWVFNQFYEYSCFSNFLAFKTPWKIGLNSFQHSSLCKIKKLLYLYSRCKIGIMIYKRFPLCHLLTNLHSISTKVNVDPRMMILLFWDIKKSTKPLFKVSWKPRNWKNKMCVKVVETSKLTISNMVFSLHYCQWLF